MKKDKKNILRNKRKNILKFVALKVLKDIVIKQRATVKNSQHFASGNQPLSSNVGNGARGQVDSVDSKYSRDFAFVRGKTIDLRNKSSRFSRLSIRNKSLRSKFISSFTVALKRVRLKLGRPGTLLRLFGDTIVSPRRRRRRLASSSFFYEKNRKNKAVNSRRFTHDEVIRRIGGVRVFYTAIDRYGLALTRVVRYIRKQLFAAKPPRFGLRLPVLGGYKRKFKFFPVDGTRNRSISALYLCMVSAIEKLFLRYKLVRPNYRKYKTPDFHSWSFIIRGFTNEFFRAWSLPTSRVYPFIFKPLRRTITRGVWVNRVSQRSLQLLFSTSYRRAYGKYPNFSYGSAYAARTGHDYFNSRRVGADLDGYSQELDRNEFHFFSIYVRMLIQELDALYIYYLKYIKKFSNHVAVRRWMAWSMFGRRTLLTKRIVRQIERFLRSDSTITIRKGQPYALARPQPKAPIPHYAYKVFDSYRELREANYFVVLRQTLNNFFGTVISRSGRVLSTISAGKVKMLGPKKPTAEAAEQVARSLSKAIRDRHLKNVVILLRSPSNYVVQAAIRGLYYHFEGFTHVVDLVPLPHNGIRRRKPRRT